MTDSIRNNALTRIRSAALSRNVATPLVKRGLADLEEKGAEWWFQRALDLSLQADLDESHRCLLKTAELDPNHVNALLWLGSDFQDGIGTAPDLSQAVDYFRRAAELGSAVAKHQIAYLFMNGSGSPEVPAESESYFRKYAERGNPCAQWVLGEIFEHGIRVRQDYFEAVRWYRKAAAQGYAYAQLALARLHEQGKGVLSSYRAAAHYYKSAAEQGLEEAQRRLGDLYYWGRGGVPEDLAEAARWYSLAAKQGDKDAAISLELCEAGITHSILEEEARKAALID